MGVRFFDFRLHYVKLGEHSQVYISHSLDTDYSLRHALEEFNQYLVEYPTELVIMYLRVDHWFRNDGDEEERSAAIYKVIEGIGLNFADQSLMSRFPNLEVKELAGKVCLMIPDNGTVIPKVHDIGIIDSLKSYEPIDIWRCGSVCEARTVLDNHMRKRGNNISNDKANILRGVCLDLTIGVIPPSWTSPGLNKWFVSKLFTDPDWVSPGMKPLGVLMMDFVDDSELIKKIYSCH